MSEVWPSKPCKFCKKMLDWDDLSVHMVTFHKEKLIEQFGTQIDEFLGDLVEDHFAELVVME